MCFKYTFLTMDISVTRTAFASVSVHLISTCTAILARVALALVYVYNVNTFSRNPH